jgi:hypothetical protein
MPILIWNHDEKNEMLLDGCSRLDSAERAGLLIVEDDCFYVKKPDGGRWRVERAYDDDPDPFAVAVAYNYQRRHLDADQRQELYIKFIALDPTKSDRQRAAIERRARLLAEWIVNERWLDLCRAALRLETCRRLSGAQVRALLAPRRAAA